MDAFDPLDISGMTGELLEPIGLTGNRSGKWSAQMAAAVLAIVGECGSPTIAAKRLGIHVDTIRYHRHKDPEFGAAYDAAIRGAVEALVTNSIARAGDISDPSNEALTLAWLRLRGDRVNAYLDGESEARSSEGLNPAVVAIMTPEDRRTLLGLLTKYQEAARALAISK